MIRLRGLGPCIAISLLAAGCQRRDAPTAVPVYEVVRGPFSHEVRAEGLLEAVESTPITVPTTVPRGLNVAWLAEDGAAVAEGEVIARFDPTEMERELLDGQAEHDAAGNKITKEQAASYSLLLNLDRDAEFWQYQLDVAQLFAERDPEVFSRIEIIEARIDEALATQHLDYTRASRVTRRELSDTEVALHEIDQRTAQIKMDEANNVLATMEVTAPHAGLVLLERHRGTPIRVGQLVWRGRKIASLPRLAKMKAEVFVLEADAGGLETGLKATMVVDAHPGIVREATVSRVDTLAKPRSPNVPVQYFGVTLELAETDVATMKPGQRVSATIRTEDRADVIAVPRQAVFDVDGQKVVYRATTTGFELTDVTLGPASHGRVIIDDGLDSGDRIALRDPTRSPASGASVDDADDKSPLAIGAGGNS